MAVKVLHIHLHNGRAHAHVSNNHVSVNLTSDILTHYKQSGSLTYKYSRARFVKFRDANQPYFLSGRACKEENRLKTLILTDRSHHQPAPFESLIRGHGKITSE